MTLQSTMTLLLIAAIIASLTGCASISVKQAWSSNFALADGTTANDPAIIDGNIGTLGQSQYVEATGDAIMGMEAQSEGSSSCPNPSPFIASWFVRGTWADGTQSVSATIIDFTVARKILMRT